MNKFKSVLTASALVIAGTLGCGSLQAAIAGTFGAIGGDDGPEVLAINGATGTTIDSNELGATTAIRAVEWSSTGTYLLAGGDDADHIHVFSFDGSSLTPEDSTSNTDGVTDVSWKKDEAFFATVSSTNGLLRTFGFDTGTQTISAGSSLDVFTDDGITPKTVDWHPDGAFIAIGGANGGSDEVVVYPVSGTGVIGALVETAAHGAEVISIKWSADGDFLAIGGELGTDDFDFRVYSWDGTSLTEEAADESNSGLVLSLDWSPDGSYIALASGTLVEVWSFDGTSVTLKDTRTVTDDEAVSVSWYPDGENILVGAATVAAGRYTSLAYDIGSDMFSADNWSVDQDAPVSSVDTRDALAAEAATGKGSCGCEINDCLVTSFRGNFAVDPCRKLLANFIDPVRLNGTTGKFEQDDDTESITCFSGNVGVGECRTLLTNRICPVVDVEISDKCTVCDAGDRGCEENAAGCLELCGDQVIIAGKLLVNEFGPFDEGCLTKDGVRTAPAPMRFAGDVDVAGNLLSGGINLGELVVDMQLEIAQLKTLLKNKGK